jgi:hypothetical protein
VTEPNCYSGGECSSRENSKALIFYDCHRQIHSADDEYTRDERRVIDARLAESEADFRTGRSFGPFDTAEAMIASMKAEFNKRAAGVKSKRSK